MSDRPNCFRCSKPIATEVSTCRDSNCRKTFHPRCASLFTRTASAPSCCKQSFPYTVSAARKQNKKKEAAHTSRASRAQMFDSDRDVVDDSQVQSQNRPQQSLQVANRQNMTPSQLHLLFSQPSQNFASNSLHNPVPISTASPYRPSHSQSFRTAPYANTPNSSRVPSYPGGIRALENFTAPAAENIVNPREWATLSPDQQSAAMYSCMYSCFVSNQQTQSQVSAISERIITAENNATAAMEMASSAKHTAAQARDEVVQLRADIAGQRGLGSAGQQPAAGGTTWGSSILISGIPESAGTDYEALAISIFKAIGASKFTVDITSATLRKLNNRNSSAARPRPLGQPRSANNLIPSTQGPPEPNEGLSQPGDNLNEVSMDTATSDSGYKTNSILVRLKAPMVRYEVIQLKVSHNGGILFVKDVFPNAAASPEAKIFLNEWLPPSTFKLLKRARGKLKKYYALWVRDGQIFARKTAESQRIQITSITDLDNLQE